ncbi:hypothetical protein Dvina_40800 [Dactylosporangium vinaceum]|uniref:Uncharacterized protein n=1 Tax=Dactylosporangium vinaceum TaxID=53362 RepID=A0ABV5M3M5_9ACTN|nr:hypothetical protein [Dactylosporangium vinaceum]UAB94427.1 hypothetical protein Dvina_40800 [Dactylosporangium vinaceum]
MWQSVFDATYTSSSVGLGGGFDTIVLIRPRTAMARFRYDVALTVDGRRPRSTDASRAWQTADVIVVVDRGRIV